MPEPQQPMQQQQQQQQQQQMTNFKSQPLQPQPPRVLEYNPHYGPGGQMLTVTLQVISDNALRIAFGTLVVDTKQYAANGYVTLSCTVPSFAITRWFTSKVPLYVLQMENDMVKESWPFGDYSYYEDTQSGNNGLDNNTINSTVCNNNSSNLVVGTKRPNSDMSLNNNTEMSMYGQSMLANKKQHLVTDLDLTSTHGLLYDDYSGVAMPSSANTADDGGLYSRPSSPYSPYAPSGYYNANRVIAPHTPPYSQADLQVSSPYAMSSTGSHKGSNGYDLLGPNSKPVAPTSYMPQPHASASMSSSLSIGSYNPYTRLLNKANLKFTGNMDDMAINWSGEEWESHRRLVQFWRGQEGNDIHCNFAPVAPADRQPNSIIVSCIYWPEKNDCFLTSVDCIYLLESLIAVRFTVEEKNRIRRNLEGFRPITVSKCKSESAEFFKLIMSFPNPKPRNIEKDVKVFPWKVLPYALKKIISKYTASYSSTASIQTEEFHNSNFPYGSTLPITPQQQANLDKPAEQHNKPEANVPQVNGLEEDDEFEEFAAQDWNEAEEEKDAHQWDDNWDDDDVEDDFSQQLRAELQKSGTAMQT
ncbi:hypothetical protein BGZ83_006615 [Gryganskiella cystojenkinii]|nr:hypothetical protein BGZ83_006615 [Gryganskiella cystojenkinii]